MFLIARSNVTLVMPDDQVIFLVLRAESLPNLSTLKGAPAPAYPSKDDNYTPDNQGSIFFAQS